MKNNRKDKYKNSTTQRWKFLYIFNTPSLRFSLCFIPCHSFFDKNKKKKKNFTRIYVLYKKLRKNEEKINDSFAKRLIGDCRKGADNKNESLS